MNYDVSRATSGAKPTVMLVEDDPIIAMDLAMQVKDLGYIVAGPFHTAATALAYLDGSSPDAAILDFNLRGTETSKPVAMRLIAENVPLTFLSGLSPAEMSESEEIKGQALLPKPVAAPSLKAALLEMVTEAGIPASGLSSS